MNKNNESFTQQIKLLKRKKEKLSSEFSILLNLLEHENLNIRILDEKQKKTDSNVDILKNSLANIEQKLYGIEQKNEIIGEGKIEEEEQLNGRLSDNNCLEQLELNPPSTISTYLSETLQESKRNIRVYLNPKMKEFPYCVYILIFI